MPPIPRINIDNYTSMFDRPSGLYQETFYRHVDIEPTPELEALANQATDVLLADGYTHEEATENVALHIHAAAVMASLTNSQQELTSKVVDTPQGNNIEDYLTPSAAISLASFLPYVTPYDFNVETWLNDVMNIDGDWERTRPALRWMELWEGKVSKAARAHVLHRLVETDQTIATPEIALYAGKLRGVLADEPELFAKLLDGVETAQSLALYGELGLDYKPHPLMPWIDDAKLISDGVRQVRHVNYYAGGCTKMDGWHESSLLGHQDYRPQAYGDVVFLHIDNNVIGSMNMYGERSVLALRTIQNASGKLAMVTGGVYVPRRELVEKAEAVFDEQGKWAHMSVDRLAFRPLRFLNIDGFNDGMELTYLADNVDRIKYIRQQVDEGKR